MPFNYAAGGAFAKGYQKTGPDIMDWLMQNAVSTYFKTQEEKAKADKIRQAYSQIMPNLPQADLDAISQLMSMGMSPDRYFADLNRQSDVSAISNALKEVNPDIGDEAAKTYAEAFSRGMPMGGIVGELQKSGKTGKIADNLKILFPEIGEDRAGAMASMIVAGQNIPSSYLEAVNTEGYFNDWLGSQGFTPEQAANFKKLPPQGKLMVMATGAETLLSHIKAEGAAENLEAVHRKLPKTDKGAIDFSKINNEQRAGFMAALNTAIPPNPADKNITQTRNYIMYGQFTNPYEDGPQGSRAGGLNASDLEILEGMTGPYYDDWKNLTFAQKLVAEKINPRFVDAEAWSKFRSTGIAGVLPDPITRAQTSIFNRMKQMLPAGMDLGAAVQLWRQGSLTKVDDEGKRTGLIALENTLDKYFEFGTLELKPPVLIKEITNLYQLTMAVEDYTKIRGQGKELFWTVLELASKAGGGWEPTFDIYLRQKNYSDAEIDQIKLLVKYWSQGEYESIVRPYFKSLSKEKE